MAEFLPKNEMALVNAQIQKATSWFELGSGFTIMQVVSKSGIKKVNNLYDNLDKLVEISNKHAKAPNTAIISEPWSKYLTFQKKRDQIPTIVYLSGQYRMACALLVATETPTTKIMFPDFLNNEYYKPVLQQLEVEARSGNLVVLKPKKDMDIAAAKKAIDTFSKDSR